jgi:glycosyltransferase involved in cell wall biosynthesis
VFVDDGSRDGTWKLIERLSRESEWIRGVKLSRNRGHQNALLAGLFTAEGDVLVSVDADLQDDIEVIDEMLRQHALGMHVVYGVRGNRSSDGLFKRATALGFYRMMRTLGIESVHNHADFRLLSRRAVDALKDFREVNLFPRGIVPLIGFKSSVVYYTCSETVAGVSKYPLHKMVALALDAVTSFSVVPLRMISLLVFIVFLLSAGSLPPCARFPQLYAALPAYDRFFRVSLDHFPPAARTPRHAGVGEEAAPRCRPTKPGTQPPTPPCHPQRGEATADRSSRCKGRGNRS